MTRRVGQSDFAKVDCAACHHVALLTPDFLLRLGLSPQAKVLDLKGRVRCRGCGAKGLAVVSVSGGGRAGEPMHSPAVSVPQSVFEGCGDFDPLGSPT